MSKALAIVMCGPCLLSLSLTAAAQRAPALSGVVRDTTGGALVGVSVTVTGASLVGPRTSVTDDHGRYVFAELPAGRCYVTAGLSGFASRSGEVDVPAAGDPAVLDLVLAVSSFSDRVTVTATRTGAADVQSTPIAITALPVLVLEQLGTQTVEGLAGVVPSVTMSQHTGGAQVTIRGIGTNSSVVGADPSSTIHLDGVYLARPAMAFVDLLDVERVEVLRGPQGTLYGRNSVGGTINIVTRPPADTLGVDVRLTAGNYDKLRAEAAVRGPLVGNRLMGSLAVLRGTGTGFVKDLAHPDHPLGSEDTWIGRGQLRLLFGSRAELLLSADSGRLEGVPLTYAKPLVAKPGFRFDNPADLWTVRTSHPAFGKNVQRGASGRLAVQLNETTTLSSLTAYRESDYRFFIDADATELALQTSDVPDVQRQVSQELTVVQRTQRLAWIGGAFYFDEHDEGRVEITVFPAGAQIRPFARIRARARALFGQATLRLSSLVSLTAGTRYTDEEKDLDNTGGVYRLGTAVLANPASFYDFLDQATFHAWTPRVAVQAQVSRETFVYASVTRGFKSGGFNPSAPAAGRAFAPEFALSYEAGWKRMMADGRIRVNAAAFYNDYQDLQVQSFIRPGVLDISNAASATIRGFEVELAAASGRALQLAANISWLDAAYDRYMAVAPGGVTHDAAGHRLNNAPEWSGSGSVVYEWPAGRAATISARADASWQSRVYFTPINDTVETQRAYGLLRLRAAFAPRSRRWEISVYVRNLGQTEYIIGTANVPLPAVTGRAGEPRQWGTQFTLRH